MTRKEVKLLMPVLQAFAEGKTLQIRKLDEETWYDTTKDNLNFNLYNYDYRVKPELKYRPFKNAEECWQEMQKHQPFGWVKLKCEDNAHGMLTLIKEKGAAVGINDTPFGYRYLFYNYTFADRQPFGIKED